MSIETFKSTKPIYEPSFNLELRQIREEASSTSPVSRSAAVHRTHQAGEKKIPSSFKTLERPTLSDHLVASDNPQRSPQPVPQAPKPRPMTSLLLRPGLFRQNGLSSLKPWLNICAQPGLSFASGHDHPSTYQTRHFFLVKDFFLVGYLYQISCPLTSGTGVEMEAIEYSCERDSWI